MAQYQGRQDPTRQTDEYGKPIRQGDEYGNMNPGRQGQTTGLHGTGMGGVGGEAGSYGLGAGGGGQGQQLRMGQQHHAGEGGGVLQRSGSGSSSSEDDGQGGRRKKGLKEKIKEKIPGVGGGDDQRHQGAAHATPNATATGGNGDQFYKGGQQQESKGVMDKIKEKIPGVGGGDDQRHQGAAHATPNATATGGNGDQFYKGGQQQESKGVMDKIKEKLPGHH